MRFLKIKELTKFYGELPSNFINNSNLKIIDTKNREIVMKSNWIPIHYPDNRILAAAKSENATIITSDNEMNEVAESEGISRILLDQLHKTTTDSSYQSD